MKRFGKMALLVLTAVLAAASPLSALACGGGQMDHSTTGSDYTGGYGHMGSGHMSNGHMDSSGQTAYGYAGNYGYANPNTGAPAPPAGARGLAPSGRTSGNDHNH